MTERLKGLVALITGCGSSGPGWGNGKAMSVAFAREGASVFGCDISPDAAQETRSIVTSEGGRMEVAVRNVALDAEVRALVAQCLEMFGRVDVLVNNVGIVKMGGVVECTIADWEQSLAVNMTSMFLMCKHVVPLMVKAGRGSIVNIGSITGIRDSGVPYVAYNATKAATNGLSRSVALQYARQNIRSNVILPGLMHTPMVSEPLRTGYGTATIDQMLDKRRSQCPTGDMGTGWDVANAAVFLASDESKYVTGAELVVDGGITAKFA